jgi:hypothetical protein
VIVHQNGIQYPILQVKFAGAAQDFAWIVPTSGAPKVGPCEPVIFVSLSHATNPPRAKGSGGFGGSAMGGTGAGSLTVLDRRTVGVYDASAHDARDANALLRWLSGHGNRVSGRLSSVVFQ